MGTALRVVLTIGAAAFTGLWATAQTPVPLNHPQFDDLYFYPGNNPQAGKITSASDYGYRPSERITQFGLKHNS
jgi:hypothetical protein